MKQFDHASLNPPGDSAQRVLSPSTNPRRGGSCARPPHAHSPFWIVSILVVLAVLASVSWAGVVPGNRFILAQLKKGSSASEWDPYPLAGRDILSFLAQTTSIESASERRIVSVSDPMLFQTPFIVFTGSAKISFTKEEREVLKRYLANGGFIFAEDRLGEKGGSFDHSFREELKLMFPDKPLTILSRTHPVYRSFYLLRTVGGRKLTNNYLEGIDVGGRTAVVYSQNDVLGAWAKDLFGNYLYPCTPGGDSQRWESQKLMMNIILYSLTGTYKTDTIHLPFIEEKLRR